MGKVYENVVELIGNTPMVRLGRFAKAGFANVIAKVEMFNPGGSVKDRAALEMIVDAEKRGVLKKGGTIIEPTSGNTGVGLAWIASLKGYKVFLTMPETMSVERRKLLMAYGADIVLTDGSKGMKGAIEKAEVLNKLIKGSVILQQFSNKANPLAHRKTTAEEIFRDLDGQVDFLVAGVGTGGTLIGTGSRLKELCPEVKVVAVEPLDSQVLAGGKAGPHKIQGIGANFVPDIYDPSVVDEVIAVPNDDAISAAQALAVEEGLLVGISSGAAAFAAKEISMRSENKGKNVVVILPDTGERYLSTELFM